MEDILYLECGSGISGDMTVAALLDLGADQKKLEQALKSLPVDGFEIEIKRVKKSGLDACDFSVKLDKAHENHDHNMEYLHGSGHAHEEHNHTCHEHEHTHTYEHLGHEHSHQHQHRGMPEIEKILREADMTAAARSLALKIFRILAQAEAKAHGVSEDQVHFHEVGAVDSIVDIAAAAVCLDNLQIKEVIVPKLCEGRGFVRCQHGLLPVPVPAVSNIVQAHGLKIHITETEGELVTPTGAAIAAAIQTGDQLPESFSIRKIGLGAGKRTYDCPSLLRAMLIRAEETEKDKICRLEANMDDCTGEALGYAMEKLLNAGARDVSYTPVFMKKNRPAYQLNVICVPEDVQKMEQIIFRETTTIGIRKMEMERTVLKRQSKKVMTPLGEAIVKECILPDGTKRSYPEYNSVSVLAEYNNLPFQEVFQMISERSEINE